MCQEQCQEQAQSPSSRIDHLKLSQSEPISDSNLESHYNIAVSQKNPIHIGAWLSQNSGDPALKVYVHIRLRI